MRASITIALLALLAAPAAADDYDDYDDCDYEDEDDCDEYDDEEEDDDAWAPGPAAPPHLDLAVGIMEILHGVDDFAGELDGFYVDAGIRRGRFFLYATYQRASGADLDDPDRTGRFHRGAVSLRHDRSALYLPLGPVRILVGPFLEGGAGYEWMRWDDGGRVSRPDLSLGLGGTIRVGRRHKGLGMEAGIRFVVAPAFAPGAEMAGCQGPCYEASAPPAADLGGMIFIGLPLSP